MTSTRKRFLKAAILFAMLPLVLVGCETTQADKDSLKRGFALYNNHQVDEAEATATKFITANPNSPNIDEAYYLRGLARVTRGGAENRQPAAEDMKNAIAKSNRPDLKCKAHRALGDIEFDSSHWSQAQDEYKKGLEGNTDEKLATYLNYRVGACMQAQGQWEQADEWFERVAAANNDAYLTERTFARMHARNFSLQFGAFAERNNANDLASQLKAAQIEAKVAVESRDGKPLYLVRVGAYKNWQEADLARDKYLAKYPLVSIVP
jgi:cell division protein FtsN